MKLFRFRRKPPRCNGHITSLGDGDGWVVKCACGWTSPQRASLDEAEMDRIEHRVETGFYQEFFRRRR